MSTQHGVRRWVLAVAAFLLAFPSADSAHARCKGPSSLFANPVGVTAPLSGETYLFVVRDSFGPNDIVGTQSGVPVPLEVTRAAGGPSYQVLRIGWRDLSPGRLVLRAGPDDAHRSRRLQTRLNLTSRWRAPRASDKQIKHWVGPATAQVSRWSCSHNRVERFPLQLPAAVYRVTFVTKSGPKTQLFPVNINQFFGVRDQAPTLSLGHVSCFGETFDHPSATTFDIEALALDGTVLSSAHGIEITRPLAPSSGLGAP